MKKEVSCVFCKAIGFWRYMKGVNFKAVACPACSFKFYKRDRYGYRLIENQRGSVSMGPIIFFLAAYVLFCGATFWYVRSETSKATEAVSLAKLGLTHAEALDAKLLELKRMIEADAKVSDESYKKLVNIALQGNSEVETLKKTVGWLEMKANNAPKASVPTSITLKQEKPLQFQVVYRPMQKRVAATEVKKKVLTEAEAKSALIKKVKEKVKELSQ
jgi:hypothetical protein